MRWEVEVGRSHSGSKDKKTLYKKILTKVVGAKRAVSSEAAAERARGQTGE